MTDFRTSQVFRSIEHYTVTEKFKAAYDKQGSARPTKKQFYLGENSWLKRCQHYDKLYNTYPLFRQACATLAGLINPQGIFFKPAVNRKDETYALAEEALYRCEQFRDTREVNSKIWNTGLQLAKRGACFWELSTNDVFDFRLPTMQEYIEPAAADNEGNITKWRQNINGMIKAEWSSDELVLIPWNATTETWPYGNGLGVGLENEMEMLVDVEGSVRDYSEKAAWPYEILQLGDNTSVISDSDFAAAKSEWRNRQPGEGIAARNMPVNIVAGGTNNAPIRELAALCDLMKDNIHDGFMVPPLSKLYNSTEASAKVLIQHIMTVLGQPLQWLIKENLTNYVLKPFLESSGFSRKSCPVALFESPDAHKLEEVQFWMPLVDKKIQSPQQVCEHLDLEYDEAFWLEQEKKEQEQEKFQQELNAKQSQPQEQSGGKEGKSWKVTELFNINKN
jgi:hypothetical protein